MNVGGKPWLQTHWDWHVAVNFLTGGAGGGLLVVALLSVPFGAGLALPMLVGALLIGGGLAQVTLHLGRPLRGINVFRNPGTSWMAREAYVSGPVLLFALGTAWLESVALGTVAALLGAAFLYCQARILTESKGIPAWREPRIVGLVLASGLVEGTALALLITLAGDGAAQAPLGVLLLVAAVARLVTWQRYRRALVGNAPVEALTALERWEGPFVGVGHAVPVLLLAVAVAVPAARDLLLVLAALAALAAGWAIKFVIVTRAGYNQGFAIMHTPARGAGTGGVGSKPGW